MNPNKYYLLTILEIIFLSSSIIMADKRSYMWTYEDKTMEAGEV